MGRISEARLLDLSELLSPRAVRVVDHITSKKRLMQELGDIASNVYGINSPDAVEALLDRETLGPTGVGHGVALPHARIEGLDRVVAAFLRLDKPMDFAAVDRQPIDLVMCLFAPVDSGVAHLKALALVSRTLREASVCSKLRANADVNTLFAILTEHQRTQAA